jgi:hypothetical protein
MVELLSYLTENRLTKKLRRSAVCEIPQPETLFSYHNSYS